jgi:hypothetical protein
LISEIYSNLEGVASTENTALKFQLTFSCVDASSASLNLTVSFNCVLSFSLSILTVESSAPRAAAKAVPQPFLSALAAALFTFLTASPVDRYTTPGAQHNVFL